MSGLQQDVKNRASLSLWFVHTSLWMIELIDWWWTTGFRHNTQFQQSLCKNDTFTNVVLESVRPPTKDNDSLSLPQHSNYTSDRSHHCVEWIFVCLNANRGDESSDTYSLQQRCHKSKQWDKKKEAKKLYACNMHIVGGWDCDCKQPIYTGNLIQGF